MSGTAEDLQRWAAVRDYARRACLPDLGDALVLEDASEGEAKQRIDDARAEVLLAWYAIPTIGRCDE